MKEIMDFARRVREYEISTREELTRHIDQSEIGKTLSGMSRFDFFREASGASPALWEKLLGPDVNNLRHLGFTASLTVRLIANETEHPRSRRFSNRDRQILTVTALTHDLAEAVVGDIPAGIKQAAEEELEKEVLRGILEDVSFFCSPEIADIVDCVPDVAFGRGCDDRHLVKLAEVFNVIQCIGYLTIALKAHRVHKQLSAGQDTVEALAGDRRDCLSEQMQRLSIETVGSLYFTRLTEPLRLPSVYGFLRKNQQEIDEIYHKSQP